MTRIKRAWSWLWLSHEKIRKLKSQCFSIIARVPMYPTHKNHNERGRAKPNCKLPNRLSDYCINQLWVGAEYWSFYFGTEHPAVRTLLRCRSRATQPSNPGTQWPEWSAAASSTHSPDTWRSRATGDRSTPCSQHAAEPRHPSVLPHCYLQLPVSKVPSCLKSSLYFYLNIYVHIYS